jgi:hypothetical protein
MYSSALRLLAGSQWRQSMMACPGCFVPMCWAESQADCMVFCYQFGGSSNSGLPVFPDRVGDWRCLAVEKLSQVELRADAWQTEPRSPRQTCVDEIDFDADAQPEEDPQ